MSSPPPTAHTLTSQEDITRFIDTINSAFALTPITTCFIIEIDSIPPPYPSSLVSSTRRRRHFAQGIIDAASHGAELVEAGDWSALALWEPPNFQGKVFADVGSSGQMRTEWRDRVKAAKAKYLRGRKFYHLSFLARNPEKGPVAGSITAVMQPFLERAKAEGVPAWLEATDLKAVALYERFGFEVVETIALGVGEMGADGWPKDGGEGVTGYCMLYESSRDSG